MSSVLGAALLPSRYYPSYYPTPFVTALTGLSSKISASCPRTENPVSAGGMLRFAGRRKAIDVTCPEVGRP